MAYRFLADALVVFHFCFVLFVITGGLFVLRWRWMALLHIPAALWGMIVEWTGWICPLTPLENRLRERGGDVAYQGDFVNHYIMPVLYPDGLTRDFQITFGTLILMITLLMYLAAFTARGGRRRRRRGAGVRPWRGFEVATSK
jgi:hypothetical protein